MAESESQGKTPLWLNLVINYTSPDFACCNYFVASARRTINSLCFLPLRLFSLSLSVQRLCNTAGHYGASGAERMAGQHTQTFPGESHASTQTHTHTRACKYAHTVFHIQNTSTYFCSSNVIICPHFACVTLIRSALLCVFA